MEPKTPCHLSLFLALMLSVCAAVSPFSAHAEEGETGVVIGGHPTAATITGIVPIANGGTAAATASAARTSLGLDTMATQAASAVAVTGGTIEATAIGGVTPAAGAFTALTGTTINGTTLSGNGAIATGGFTLTIPATGTVALLGTGNAFTGNNTSSGTLNISNTTASTSTAGALLVGTGTAATTVTFGGGSGNIGASLTIGAAATVGTTLTVGNSVTVENATSAATNDALLHIYRTNGSGSGDFASAGNMVLQARTSTGASRDIIFYAGNTTGTEQFRIVSGGGVTSATAVAGASIPAYSAAGTSTIVGAVTDGYTSSHRFSPTYSAATALTVTRHNYIVLNTPVLAGVGPAAVTDAAVFRFDAAVGTHKALAANASVAVTLGSTGPTGSTAGAPQGWLKWNVNGTLRYTPFW